MKNVNLVEINQSELESFKKNCPIWGNEDLPFTSNYTAEEDEMDGASGVRKNIWP